MLDTALRRSGARLESLMLQVDSLTDNASVNVGGAALGGILTQAGPTLRHLVLLYDCSTDSLRCRGSAAGEASPYPSAAIAAEVECLRMALLGCGFTASMATRVCCQAATDRVVFEF